MDINAIVNEEVEKRVQERLKENEAEIQRQVENRLEAIKQNMIEENTSINYNQIIDEIDNVEQTIVDQLEQFRNKIISLKDNTQGKQTLSKCNFPDCKNYGDGSIDNFCKDCDNYKVKMETIQKEAKEHSDIKQYHEEKEQEQIQPVTNDENKEENKDNNVKIDCYVNGEKVDVKDLQKVVNTVFKSNPDYFNKDPFWKDVLRTFF